MPNQYNRWTAEENEVMQRMYHVRPLRELVAALPRHTRISIMAQGRKLGLTKSRPRYHKWTKKELGLLAELYPYALKEDIIKALPTHTWLVITRKAVDLGIKRFWYFSRAKQSSRVAIIAELRRIRLARHIKIKELAKRLGYSATNVAQWELGMSYPKFANFLNWCDLLGYEPALKEKATV